MKSEALLALEVQYRYMNRFMLESDDFEDALDVIPYEGEKTPREIFEHSIRTLYTHSYAELHGVDRDEVIFEFLSKMEARERMLEAYKEAIDKFRQMREKFDEQMDEIVHEESGTTRRQVYSTLAMHTIHHNAQAMLIANMNIRSKKTG